MNLDELLLNIKNVTFDSLVGQTEIQTSEDKKRYENKGYRISLTENEFREKFRIDPSCVWYTPSLTENCLYFNKDTLAAAPFHMDLFLSGLHSDMDGFYKSIAYREQEVAENHFAGSIMALPDAMRLEYFKFLVEKKGENIPGLYDLFFSTYLTSDYGFGNIDAVTLKAILDSKTDEDIEKTRLKLRDFP